ncbi:MAG: hypothetical protein WBI04_05025 [Trichlorobacter sp.]
MKKLSTLVVMLVLLACSTSAFAGTIKMIGTVTGIKIQGNGADITLKDRKTEAPIALKVTNPMELDKYKDKKIKVGDELRIIYDSDTKIIKRAQKTAGC